MNVKEPSELTWATCPAWAKDRAANLYGSGNVREFLGSTYSHLLPGLHKVALMIARHEEQPPEPVDPALVAAKEVALDVLGFAPDNESDDTLHVAHMDLIQIATTAYKRGAAEAREG